MKVPHRWKLLAVLATLAVALLARTVILWPRSRIVQEDADRIKHGMTRAQVEAILGPPGDYRTEQHSLSGMWLPGKRALNWEADAGGVRIVLDSEDRVATCSWFPQGERDSELDQFIRWAKRQWRRWFP
jgi:hypothetical protein